MDDYVFKFKQQICCFAQGFARVQPLQGDLPNVVSKVPWDGGEGVLEEAEEFSLEDIMADDEL